jgi:hypothetical protein
MTIRQTLLTSFLVAVGLFVCDTAVQAQTFYQPQMQGRGRMYSPTVSPYLNLLRRDGSAAINYQTLVRPQMQQIRTNLGNAAAIEGLERSAHAMTTRSSVRGDASDLVRPTGQSARFFDYGHFYGQIPIGGGLGPSTYSASGGGGGGSINPINR